jgi:transcriptional regulator with XRE-family HTH domain
LRIARSKADMTLMELEAASGVGASTISKIERGVSQPQATTLHKLAEALDVDVADLLGEPNYPKGSAPPSQRSLFNGEERRTFIERWERHVAARVAHYENRLALEKSSGPFAGYKRAQTLQDEAFEEFSQLLDVISGEAVERWLGDPEIPEATKEELGFELVEVEDPFIQVVGRIGDRVKELAETQAEKEKAKREKERQLEEMHKATHRHTA